MRSPTILVIGYGNDLRGDDGAGQQAATRVGRWGLPGVQIRALHQLTPELAALLADSDRAIFLDAHPASHGTAVHIRQITAATTPRLFAHAYDPQALLHLTQTVFGRSPEAWWVTIPALDFSVGAPLSALAECGIADALTGIRRLLTPSVSTTEAIRGSAGARAVT